MGPQKINAQYRKLDGCLKKTPREKAAREPELKRYFAPALNGQTRWPGEALASCWEGRMVRNNRNRSSGIHKKTPVTYLVPDVDQKPGGNGLEPPRAA